MGGCARRDARQRFRREPRARWVDDHRGFLRKTWKTAGGDQRLDAAYLHAHLLTGLTGVSLQIRAAHWISLHQCDSAAAGGERQSEQPDTRIQIDDRTVRDGGEDMLHERFDQKTVALKERADVPPKHNQSALSRLAKLQHVRHNSIARELLEVASVGHPSRQADQSARQWRKRASV